MRITKWGEYGILCSMELGRAWLQDPAGSLDANSISNVLDIPVDYTQQILQRLRKAKIIESIRGPNGGYRLTSNPDQINLKSILRATEGQTFEMICEGNAVYSDCNQRSNACSLHLIWKELEESIDKVLSSKTIKSLISDQNNLDHSGLFNIGSKATT